MTDNDASCQKILYLHSKWFSFVINLHTTPCFRKKTSTHIIGYKL